MWGLDDRREPLSVSEWAELLWYREEMEYDVPGLDAEPYEAANINRFRGCRYALRLVASFWRVTETTKMVSAWL